MHLKTNLKHSQRNARIIPLVIVLLLMGGMVYLYNSKIFEQNPPLIQVNDIRYWNLKSEIPVTITDESGLTNYKVVLDVNGQQSALDNQVYTTPEASLSFSIKPPRFGIFGKEKSLKIHIEATDGSKWNFLSGNTIRKTLDITIDNRKPKIMTLSHSYSITKGGSALVVFKAEDESLDELYLEAGGHRFQPQKFYKDGYYATLIAWPVMVDNFQAAIHATDKAGNSIRKNIRYFLKDKKYKLSELTVKDKFLEGKLATLADDHSEGKTFEKPLERFIFVNEKLRAKNEKHIYEIASKIDPAQDAYGFSLTPFYPLKNAAAVASFGDHRIYSYQKEKISESYHMGLDLASVKNAPILTSNDAIVNFAEDNGIYGNSIILNHGLGLSTLYGHCETLFVNVGEQIPKGTKIALTGMTGLAFGDHLHFGILVQGIEVRPEEWMDKKWMQLNVFDILEGAKKMIDSEVS